MNRKYIICSAIVLTVMILITAGYYWWGSKPEPAITEIRKNVSICYATPLSGLITIAGEQGFFSQNGLDVTLKQYPLGKMSLEGMFNGECDVATSGETPIMFSSFYRNDFGILGSISASDNYAKIAARKDAGIQKPEDLKGKRIATQKGTQLHFFLYVFMAAHDISEDQVTLLFKNADEMPEALAKGEIDAFSLGEPYISRAKKLLRNDTIIFSGEGISYTSSNLVALNSFIKKDPEVINKILLSLIQAEEFAKKYPDDSIDILSKKHKIDKSEMTALWIDTDWEISLDQSLLLVLDDEARWAIKNKLTNGTDIPNYLNFIHMNYLEEVKPQAVTIIR